MRTYGITKSTIWNGPTGRQLYAAGADAQLMSLYLFTNPHANAIGLYYLPFAVIPSEVALGIDQIRATFSVFDQLEFAHYDDPSQVIWVREMACHQLGECLDVNDGKVKAVLKAYRAVPPNPFLGVFFDRYAAAFHLTERRDVSTGGRNLSRQTNNAESTDGSNLSRPSDSSQRTSEGGPRGASKGGPKGPPYLVPDLDPVPVQVLPESTSTVGVQPPASKNVAAPLDAWCREFIQRYPEQGRTTGFMTESQFHEVFRRDARAPAVVYRELCEALENHKQSAQWARKMIPRLDNWLRGGLYTTRLPATDEPGRGGGLGSVAAHNRRMLEANLAKRRPQ